MKWDNTCNGTGLFPSEEIYVPGRQGYLGPCVFCNKRVSLRKDGTVRSHVNSRVSAYNRSHPIRMDQRAPATAPSVTAEEAEAQKRAQAADLLEMLRTLKGSDCFSP